MHKPGKFQRISIYRKVFLYISICFLILSVHQSALAEEYSFKAGQFSNAGNSSQTTSYKTTTSVGMPFAFKTQGQSYDVKAGFLYTAIITTNPDATPPTGTVRINNDSQYATSTTVTLTLSAQDNQGGSGISQMRLSNDGATYSSPEIYATAKTWTLSTGDGTKAVYVKFSDKAGNWSTAYSDTVILDTIAPMVNINLPANPYIKDSTYLLAGNKSSDVTSITLEVSPGSVTVGTKSYTSTTWQCQLSSLTEGAIALTVYCWDLAGNPSPFFSSSLIVDRTAPSTPALTTQPPNLTNQPTLLLSGTKETDSSVWLNSQELGLGEVVPINRYQLWDCQFALAEGENHISLFSKDYADNQSAALNLPLIILDTQPPQAPTLNDVTSPTNNPKCLLSGAKEPNSSIWLNNQEIVPLNSSSSWSYIFKLSEGRNDLTIFSKDQAANTSTAITRTVTLDTAPPAVPTIDLFTTPTDLPTQELTGAKSADAQAILVECPTAEESEVTYPSPTTWKCAISNMAEGKNHVFVIASDELGNQTTPIEAVIDYSPYSNLSNTASDEINPDIAIYGNEIFVAWQDPANSNVYFKSSSDGGATWQPTAGPIGQGCLPKMAIDNSGNIYVVLGGGNPDATPLSDGGGIYLVRSTDKGRTFGSPVNIGIGYTPDVAVSDDGNKVYVAWYRKEADNDFTVQCRASGDAGGTFLPAVQISDVNVDLTQAQVKFGLDLAANADGRYAYCAFPRLFGNFWKIAFSYSSDSGATFATNPNINPEPHNGYNPQLAASGSDVYVVWQHDAYGHNHIWLRSSGDNGRNFSAAVRIDDGDNDTTSYKTPGIAVDGKGTVYAAFVNATNSVDDIYIDSSLNRGRDFGADIKIDAAPPGTLQRMPRIAVNSAGALYSVVWQDNRNVNNEIYIRNFKTFTPIDWLKSQMGNFGFLDSFQDDGKYQANTYDQALAVIAFVSAGELDSAKRVLNALKSRQNPDGSWYSAYHPDTGENTDTENSKYTGAISWVITAINFYTQASGDISYLEAAKNAAEWAFQFFDNDPNSPTYGSLTGGSLGQAPISWRSTEHNIDAHSAFKYLQKLLDENHVVSARNYSAAADLIRAYLMAKMWNNERFLTGWEDDSRYLDVNPLAILALGMRPDNVDIRPVLAWAEENLSLQIDWDAKIKGIKGFDEMVYFGQLPNKIWTEGTEQMVSAYNVIGKANSAAYYHKQIKRLQQPNLGIPYSTLGSQGWPRNAAVSSTCWFYFNQRLPFLNPLNPTSVNQWALTVDDFNDVFVNQNSLGFYTDDDATCVEEDTAGAHHLIWASSGSYWYSTLFGMTAAGTDIRPYKYLSFKIKSRDLNGDFIVRLEDREKRFDVNIKDYVSLCPDWQYVNIPIIDFVIMGFDAQHAKTIAFVFNKDASGEIWFDDLKFSAQSLAPFISITAPQKIYSNIPAQFSSAGSGDYDGSIVWYEWNFGDGAISNEPNLVHTYITPGNYIIFLKVKDNDGVTAQAQKPVVVYEAPLITGELSFISDKDDDLIYADGIVVISAVTAAIEGQNLQHRFKIDGQIAQDYSADSSYQWDTRAVSKGRHFIEYDVKDEFGNTSHRQAYVYVHRRPIAPPS